MLKIRTLAALILFAIAFIFLEQNLSWTIGLYGAGEYSNLYSAGLVNKNNDGSLYLVKTKRVRENLEFTYRVGKTNYLKLPLWPFATTIVSDTCASNTTLINDLFTSNFGTNRVEQGLYLFKDSILVIAIILAILGKILLGKSNSSSLKTKLYWANQALYH